MHTLCFLAQIRTSTKDGIKHRAGTAMLPALVQLESRRLFFAILTGTRAEPPVVPAALHARQHLAARDVRRDVQSGSLTCSVRALA